MWNGIELWPFTWLFAFGGPTLDEMTKRDAAMKHFSCDFFPLFFVYKGWTKPWYDIKLSSYCIGSLTGDVFKSVSAWFCWLHLTSKDKMETLFQRMQRSVKIIQSSGVGSVLEWNERSNVGNTERWVESVKLVERTVAKLWGNRVQISNPTSKNRC